MITVLHYMCDPLTSHYHTFLEIHFIAYLLSITTKKVSAFRNEYNSLEFIALDSLERE